MVCFVSQVRVPTTLGSRYSRSQTGAISLNGQMTRRVLSSLWKLVPLVTYPLVVLLPDERGGSGSSASLFACPLVSLAMGAGAGSVLGGRGRLKKSLE
jgi:hypothetical protein